MGSDELAERYEAIKRQGYVIDTRHAPVKYLLVRGTVATVHQTWLAALMFAEQAITVAA